MTVIAEYFTGCKCMNESAMLYTNIVFIHLPWHLSSFLQTADHRNIKKQHFK